VALNDFALGLLSADMFNFITDIFDQDLEYPINNKS
jgi:hypothetical protein